MPYNEKIGEKEISQYLNIGYEITKNTLNN